MKDRENVIKFYSKALTFTYCCWRIAKYENKAMIGDVLRISKTLSDREKIGALKLAESLRRKRGQEMFKESLNIQTPEDIAAVLQLYETWWQSPLPLEEKLQVNPLDKSRFSWGGP